MNSSFQIHILVEVLYVELQLFAVTNTNGVSPNVVIIQMPYEGGQKSLVCPSVAGAQLH